MSNYFYTGITAYMKNNNEANARLSLLAEAMFQLQPFIGMHNNDFTGQEHLLSSDAFAFIRANDTLFTNNALAFPQNTPKERQSVDLSTVTVKGIDFVKLHIPVISEDQEELHHMVDDCLLALLTDLFGDDLVTVKAKYGSEWAEFDLLQEDVIISASRFANAA